MKIKTHKNCILCGRKLPESFVFCAENMPASAQDLPKECPPEKETGVKLTLKKCTECGLYQFDCEPVDYYKDVIRAVGLSDTMKDLRRADYAHMIEKYKLSGKKWIECGCGNGDFLKVLSEFPVEVYGIENDSENIQNARAGLTLSMTKHESLSCTEKRLVSEKMEHRIMQMFTDDSDMKIPGGPFDCFLSFNFLEHQPDPCTMLTCMYNNLSEGGYGLITVPSFEYILNENHYYELIRDHIANYTLDSLKYLCKKCGFEVLEEGFIGIGDTLRAVIRRPVTENSGNDNDKNNTKRISDTCSFQSDVKESQTRDNKTILTIPESDNSKDSDEPGSLEKNRIEINEKVRLFIERLRREGKTLALFGAGHQGFTLASTTELGKYADCIIDNAKFKQGKYSPASYLKIISADEFFSAPADVVVIVAPAYIKEIKAGLQEKIIKLRKNSDRKLKNIEILGIFDIID